MKLTKSADYALRILIYLAGKEQQITNTALSKALEVPYHNLTKIIQHLARSEVIRSKKGKNGGITLNKRPEDISVRQVISIIDGPLNLSEIGRAHV